MAGSCDMHGKQGDTYTVGSNTEEERTPGRRRIMWEGNIKILLKLACEDDGLIF
jgi:hypothetical protein